MSINPIITVFQTAEKDNQLGFDSFTSMEIAEIIWLWMTTQENKNTSPSENNQEISPSPTENKQENLPIKDIDNFLKEDIYKQQKKQKKEASKVDLFPKTVTSDLPLNSSESEKNPPLQIPDASTINQRELERAFKGLLRKIESATEQKLDIVKTVNNSIAQGFLNIEYKPTLTRRWLDLVLVVEINNSLVMWKEVIEEFRQLLRRLPVFRQIDVWGLKFRFSPISSSHYYFWMKFIFYEFNFDDNFIQQFEQVNSDYSLTKEDFIKCLKLSYFLDWLTKEKEKEGIDICHYDDLQMTPLSPKAIANSNQREPKLILVASDLVSRTWYSPQVYQLLWQWSNYGTVTLLQFLPKRLWSRTALSKQPSCKLSSSSPVSNNELLQISQLEDSSGKTNKNINENQSFQAKLFKIPVISLESFVIEDWVDLITATGGNLALGYGFQSLNIKFPQLSAIASITPQDRIKRFRKIASPTALRLAEYLSPVLVTLPVIRVIKKTMLPQANQSHIAEVLMGGLIQPLKETIIPHSNPDEIEFKFFDGVREELIKTLTHEEIMTTIEEVSVYIAEKMGKSLKEFEALLISSKHKENYLAQQLYPLAQVQAQVLQQLGGEYSKFAEEIEQGHSNISNLVLEGIPIISDGVYLEDFDQTPITAKIVKLFLEKYGKSIRTQKFLNNPNVTQIKEKRLINLPPIQIKFSGIKCEKQDSLVGFTWHIDIIFPINIRYVKNKLTKLAINNTSQEDSLEYIPIKIITIPEQLIKGSISCFPVKSQSTESNNEEVYEFEVDDLILNWEAKDKSGVSQLILFNGYQIDNYFDKVNFPSSIQSEDWEKLLNNQDISKEDLINLLLPFEQIYKLWQGLLSSYESYNEFESFIFDTFADFLGEKRDLSNLESIVGNGNYSSVVFNIIEWVRAIRKLDKLISKSYEKNPNNELIKEVYDYIFTETIEDDIFANLKEFDINVTKIQTEPSETPQPKQETRKALVVGLNNYQSDRLPNLNNATYDADEIAKMLEDYGDFQITKYPTDDRLTWDEVTFGDDLQIGNSMPRRKINLTKEELENALIELFTPEGDDIPDIALFYFSGHGFRQDKVIQEGFLATSDALPERGFYGLSLQWLRRLLEKSPIPNQIIWLDCCFSGELFTWKSQKWDLGEKGKINNSLFVLLSSVPHKVSSESKNSAHGAFTKNLLEALNPKRLSKQFITNYDVIQYLNRQIDIKNLNQHIVYWSILNKEFILTRLTIELKTFISETVFVNKRGEIIDRQPVEALYFEEELAKGINLNMMQIPAGEFWMGTEDEEIERLVKKFEWDGFRREKPQHKVTIKQEFYMSQTPITQAQWKVVAKLPQVARELTENPSDFKGDDNLPVEQVSWYNAVEFCARLSRETGKNYRLPSEAEWEYACRGKQEAPLNKGGLGGLYPPFSFGETITDKLANYDASFTYADEQKGKYRPKTTPVGQFYPNGFGLYDMHGNVWEWCADTYYYIYNNAPNDGSVWDKENNDNRYQNYPEHIDTLLNDSRNKVLRGGSWRGYPRYCRSAYRGSSSMRIFINNDGFRVVCS